LYNDTPAQQPSLTTPVTSVLHKTTIKTATARAKITAGRKKWQGHGSKKQAVIDDEIDLQHILSHWNYCHKKFRQVSFSSWDDSKLYELDDFVPLADSCRGSVAVGSSSPKPVLLALRDEEMLTNSPEEATTAMAAMSNGTERSWDLESRDEGMSNGTQECCMGLLDHVVA
jgi:hypothetical protein